jgi:hypothetical protein
MRVINLYGGPGTGKSTTAAHLFYLMKSKGIKVELVTEYAKDLVYSESFFQIKDQLMVFARQHHRMWKLRGKVDWVIVDSPLPLSLIYAPEDMMYSYDALETLVLDTYSKYDNYSFFIQRDAEVHGYQEYGRSQSEEEAMLIDDKITTSLHMHRLDYQTVGISNAAESIFATLPLEVR